MGSGNAPAAGFAGRSRWQASGDAPALGSDSRARTQGASGEGEGRTGMGTEGHGEGPEERGAGTETHGDIPRQSYNACALSTGGRGGRRGWREAE